MKKLYLIKLINTKFKNDIFYVGKNNGFDMFAGEPITNIYDHPILFKWYGYKTKKAAERYIENSSDVKSGLCKAELLEFTYED